MNRETAAALAATVDMSIGGAGFAAPGTFGVVNPSTGEVFAPTHPGRIAQCWHGVVGRCDGVRELAARRRRAAVLLENAAEAVAAAIDEIAALISAEQGKVFATAMH